MDDNKGGYKVPLPVMHTAVGMSFPFLAWAAVYAKVKRVTSRMLFMTALFMILAGAWAEVPDMPRFLPQKYKHLENDITESKYGNIFFFHKFLDTHEAEDRGLAEGALSLFLMFFSILFATVDTISKNGRQIKSTPERKKILPIEIPTVCFKDIIDIHCHVLPGIDDGPEDIVESVRMCKRAVELGIKHIVATPHMPWQGKYEKEKIRDKYDLLKRSLEKEDIGLTLSLGADIRIEWDLIDKIRKGEVFTIAGGRYFLLELDEHTVPDSLEDFLDNCIAAGFIPIITHPERNLIFQADIERLKKIHEKNVLIQITAASFAGTSGSRAGVAAFECLRRGIVDIIATDAHSYNFRLEEMPMGLNAVLGEKTLQELNHMVRMVPQLVINNEYIEKVRNLAQKAG